ncbi:MAG: hypothetical protein ABW174_01200 [Flavitalea sp.]
MSNFPNNPKSYDSGFASAGTPTEMGASVWDYLDKSAPDGERQVSAVKPRLVAKNQPQHSSTLRTNEQLMPYKIIGLIVLISAIFGACFAIKTLID